MSEWQVLDSDINGNRKVFNNDSDVLDVAVSHLRKVKRIVPDNEKDERYWEKRKRNNIAAKRSRENKRVVEISIRHKMALLEEENNLLKKENSTIKAKFGISPDSVFLTDEDREKCRVKYGPMDAQHSREEESSSPGSSVSACASPHTITKTEFCGNTGGYAREEAFDRSSPDSSLHFHKKKLPLSKHQQRIPGAFPFPQTLFYGSSYGAQLMWASARCPGPVGGMQQIYQEYALNNGPVSPPNNSNNNNNNNIVMPRSQYSHYAPTQISTNTRPQDYLHYRSTNPEYDAEYEEMGGPTDLSAPRDKYPEHGQTVKREDPTEVRHTYPQTTQSREEQPHVSVNTLQTPKRRYSQEYSNDTPGHTGVAVQAIRAAGAGHQTSQVPHNYSTPDPWTEQRSPVDTGQAEAYNSQQRSNQRSPLDVGQTEAYNSQQRPNQRSPVDAGQTEAYNSQQRPNQRSPVDTGQAEAYNSQQRPNDGYYENGSGYQQQSTRLEAPYQHPPAQPTLPVGNNEQLRKENEDLKVGLRQLFSQVFKMKDIVLPN